MRPLPGLPRVPTCGCRRSPGGARDGPDEQGGIGEPRVARQDRRLLSLRACPRSRDSLSLSCSRHKNSAGPPRDPRPSASAPPARSRRGGGGGCARRAARGPRPRASREGAAREAGLRGGGEGPRASRGSEKGAALEAQFRGERAAWGPGV